MTTQRISIAANPRIPAPKNEPAREFRPGSPEAESVLQVIDRLNNEVREITHIVNGERIGSAETSDVVAPHDHGHVYATLPATDTAVIDRAIQAALDAQHDWSRTPWWERAAIFQRVGELAAGKYRDELVATTMIGQSKTFHQAEIDAACEVTDFMRFNTALAAEIYADQPPSLTGDINTIDQRPLEGFVLALTPFNFTAIAANLPTTPALMGNTVVWKTSEKSALSSEVLYRVFEEAGLPPGVINVVHGSGRAIAERALAHPDFAGLTFTGSTEVFRGLWKQAAQNIDAYKSFPRIVGETGGKNAVVAHPTADPDAARTALIRAAFEYQGQKCSAASRAYIARSVWEAIRDELVETVRSLPVGDPTKHETYVGAVIDETALRRLEDAFRRASELESHTLLAGGEVHDETGWFVEPTIYESTDPTAFTFREEFFGPLLAVHVYEDEEFEDVLPLIDSASEYALTLSIFASDRAAISHALDVLRNTAGMTYINDKPSGALMGQVSFGGGRASGTNDKTGSRLALQRWVNGRFIKESLAPATDWTYPYLQR
ncbi:L-glutamate gamma-semialdehyde dehydrogenase [Gulosibacter sp. 10]|uniref:L-glutamate gamma-semialdehyde dehydrogenase n=1 Tax=Gulosibacter sp. 10 TaxID=1255570 RepID=UPI00097EBFEE|nr:L-glutamate gamma-semialdehyde dehydrogenase [Gulosibacter sp. 10]SJM63811.1 Delta-1-pyrroline-5-carboxylate dehydrogenase [Gulosibacter sp. 10]